MSFLVFLLIGFAGGLLGGMGMGGGTVLIPLLTIFCGVEQRAAQGVCLLAFLPASALALSVHAKNGLIDAKGVWPVALAALIFSVLFSLIAVGIRGETLRRAFGLFLLALSAVELSRTLREGGRLTPLPGVRK